jgi:O-antigen ligase
MWKQVLEDFSQNPLIGRGLWVYYLRDNYYMRVLGETGLVGIAAFAGLLIAILREEWRAIRARTDDDFVRGVAVGLLPATVGCLLVFQLSGDFFVVHRFMGVFWAVLALVLKYCLGIGVTDAGRDRRAS